MPVSHTDFGIYLHWPFCQSKCPYCDFNSHVADAVDQKKWAAAFEQEISRLADEVGPRLVKSIYFGGGTPSLMHPDAVDRILSAIRRYFSLKNDVEITLEANPTSVEVGRFIGYRDAGVNRVSMGFQALNDVDLRALGRLHTVASALAALESARTVFDRINFDLIYARQHQSLKNWEDELRMALDLGPTHLSLYQLTIEDGTAFAQRFNAGALRGLPGEDLAVDLFNTTQELCDANHLPAYEVSNHARSGQESVHNQIYWRGGDYLGIGPGAHGRITMNGSRFATTSPKAPGAWLAGVLASSSGEEDRECLSAMEWAEEIVLMGLRTAEGIDLSHIQKLTGKKIDPSQLVGLKDLGLLHQEGDQIRTTLQGRLVLNGVIREVAGLLL